MANLRDIRKRIKSVKNTQQITKAMKLVSAAKLRRAQDAVNNAAAYSDATGRILGRIIEGLDLSEHPWVKPHEQVKKVIIIVLSSDRGLCGALNNNLFKAVYPFAKSLKDESKEVFYLPLGRKAKAAFKKEENLYTEFDQTLPVKANYKFCQDLVQDMVQKFSNGEFDEVYLFYNHFKSVLTQEPTKKILFPLNPGAEDEESQKETSSGEQAVYITEPNAEELIDELLPVHLTTRVLYYHLNNIASEHGSRMTAMDSASRNASDMIDSLTLTYNQARQAAITTELIEIISGAEALKG